MPLADLIENIRNGIVQIGFFNAQDQRIGGGTGFLSRHRLITNNHVFLGYQPAQSVRLRREGQNPVALPSANFAERLHSGSDEISFDYAIMDVPELFDGTEY